MKKTSHKILEYLKRQGPTNTFKLARELGIERYELLNIIKELEEKGAVKFKVGMVTFLRFLTEEKEIAEKGVGVKETLSKLESEGGYKAIARKSSILEDIQVENNNLKKRLSELEASIKRQSNIKSKIRDQNEHIEKLEGTIKGLQQKVAISHKVIRRAVTRKIPIKLKEKRKIETKPKKFWVLKLNWMKSIQQLKILEFIEQKMNIEKPEINFAELNKNIQQIRIPEILK